MKKAIFIISIILFSFTSCNDDDSNETYPRVPIQLTAEQENMNESGQLFAWELLEKVYLAEENNREKKNMNLLLSPLSLNYSLAMLQNGANGETLNEILAATNIGDYSLEAINAYYETMSEGLVKADRGTIFSNSNSIWYNENISLEDEFINLNKKAYDAEITAVNFSDPNTVNRINQWCSDKTNGKIPKIKNEISSATILELLNAIYFYGTWAKKFDESKTEKDVFTCSDGEKVDASFMQGTFNTFYYENDLFVFSTLAFGNGACRMFFILPKENVPVTDVFTYLKGQRNLMELDWIWMNVDYMLPKFETSYDIDMVNTSILQSLGIQQLFTPSADLSKMTGANTLVSGIIQKTYLKIDEKSVEVAGVTDTGASYAPPSVAFSLDRPFLYGILEESTSCLLFLGYMDDPTVKE